MKKGQKKPKWTEEMTTSLQERYLTDGGLTLSQEFGISLGTVLRKAGELGLRRVVGRTRDSRSITDVFWSNIKKLDNGCWEWQGPFRGPYGAVNAEGKQQETHRVSYELHKGPIPEKAHVCHRCDNPACCNPEHLFLGDNRTNTADRHTKRRDAIGERNGNSKLTADIVRDIRRRYIPRRNGKQLCEEYGIDNSQLNNIIKRHQWAWVD